MKDQEGFQIVIWGAWELLEKSLRGEREGPKEGKGGSEGKGESQGERDGKSTLNSEVEWEEKGG